MATISWRFPLDKATYVVLLRGWQQALDSRELQILSVWTRVGYSTADISKMWGSFFIHPQSEEMASLSLSVYMQTSFTQIMWWGRMCWVDECTKTCPSKMLCISCAKNNRWSPCCACSDFFFLQLHPLPCTSVEWWYRLMTPPRSSSSLIPHSWHSSWHFCLDGFFFFPTDEMFSALGVYF